MELAVGRWLALPGRVFGINSTGFDGTNDFYISRINEIFSLEIEAGESDSITIQQLVNEGQ